MSIDQQSSQLCFFFGTIQVMPRPPVVLCLTMFATSNALQSSFAPSTVRSGRDLLVNAQYVHRPQRYAGRTGSSSRLKLSMGPLDGLITAAKYRETCPPQSCVEQLLIEQIRKQDLDPSLLHWAHPITMLLLVAPCMVFAANLGWKIRGSTRPQDGSNTAAKLTAEERRSAGSLHAILMSTAVIFSTFGIQGGLGSMLLAREPILESSHSASGFLFTALFGLQVASCMQCPLTRGVERGHVHMCFV